MLSVCMVDQTQMSPSSISPLGLFQGIKYNIERLKGDIGALNLLGCGGGTSDPSLYYVCLIPPAICLFPGSKAKIPQNEFFLHLSLTRLETIYQKLLEFLKTN